MSTAPLSDEEIVRLAADITDRDVSRRIESVEEFLEDEDGDLDEEARNLAFDYRVALEALKEARAWVRRLTQESVVTCVYCGHAYPPGSPTHGADALKEHIRVCEKHPMREVERERDKAKRSLEFARDWYQQRFNRLRQWINEEVRPLSADVATRYFAIVANGSPAPHESADWRETMHGLTLRAERAERERDKARRQVAEAEQRAREAAIEEAALLCEARGYKHGGFNADIEAFADGVAARVRGLKDSPATKEDGNAAP